MSQPDYRIGCDIGGSFTDFLLYEATTGRVETLKVPTTPQAPEQGLLQGLALLAAQNPDLASHLRSFIHGTTLVINAILERKGARTALLTTKGFRDIIETRREIRYDIYDIRQDYPLPIVPRNLRFGVTERLDHRGEVVTSIDLPEAVALLRQLEGEGIESAAICFINSYANGAHEAAVENAARAAGVTLSLSLSSEVLPEVREFERFATTAMNAYVKPKMDRYLRGVDEALRDLGYRVPLSLMQSGGGIITSATARHSPVRLAESGPVGGVLAARDLGRAAGHEDILAFDLGGTTAKSCLIQNGTMPITRAYEVDRVHRFKRGSGTPLAVPTVDLIEIGAGGGSIARVDDLGRLKVGPESAVADPGPACYGRGGSLPTVTDANLVLGYLDPAEFKAGNITLDESAAHKAIETHIAAPLGISVIEAAVAIIDIVNENMSQAARIYAAENGGDLPSSVMVAFGGGGPLHGEDIARKLKIGKILVPEAAGVFSALGFIMAAPSYEVSRSLPRLLTAEAMPAAAEVLRDLEATAAQVVAEAAPGSEMRTQLFADLRYFGQGHQLRVPVDVLDPAQIASSFQALYQKTYGYNYDDMEIEIVTLRAISEAPATGPAFRKHTGGGGAIRQRQAWDGSQMAPHACYRFDEIAEPIIGPALISQPGATIRLAPGSRAEIAPQGWLEIQVGA